MSDSRHKLVLASHNQGKIDEIKALVADLPLQIVEASSYNLVEPEEYGETFFDNAKIKAISAMRVTGMPALADDSGLCVEALDGQPGIYTARWTLTAEGKKCSQHGIKTLLEKISHKTNRKAKFICVLAYAVPGEDVKFFAGEVQGHIAHQAMGGDGFGYDPIFCPDGYDISFAQMPGQEKQKISHRAQALQKFKKYLHNVYA